MQCSIRVITPAKNFALVTDYAAKLSLNMSSSTDFGDKQLGVLIEWTSGEIAVMCNRVFARETVEETWRDFDTDSVRIWLTHYPVSDIESVIENDLVLVEDIDYEIDVGSGKLRRLNSVGWSEPVIITYTGGYNLPFEAPLALQQAAIMMTREAYYASTRGDATTRMVSHKETRVIYFDPNARGGTGGGAGGSPARRAVNDLLKRFTRVEV